MCSRLRINAFTALAIGLALSLLGWMSTASAANIRFVGNVGYSYVGNVATLTADRIENDDIGGFSGTLRMELWAFSTPYTGDTQFGYKLAQYTVGQLNGGFGFPDVNSGSVPFFSPPNGVWHFTMAVTEFIGTPTNDGYITRDYVNFSSTVTIGPPSPPPPPALPPSALENPASGSYQSGIGLISGWSCEGPVSVSVDGTMISAPYGAPRGDTTSLCSGSGNNGFGILVNYNNFGPGTHTAQLYVKGTPRGSPSSFTVTVPAGEFMRGLSQTVAVPNFPSPGRTTVLIWQESQQNFAIQSVFP